MIEKSGIEEDQGFEPPPSPPPRRYGFWPWSRPVSYRYLTSSVVEAIRRAPVKRRRWQFIVVHNSGTRQGNARVFDYYHRACSPDAERSCLSFRDRQRHINRQRPESKSAIDGGARSTAVMCTAII